MTPWVGFKYFTQLFSTAEFWSALRNTITISLLKLIFAFPVPIALALLLNEVKSQKAKGIDAGWDAFIAEMKSAGMDDFQKEVANYMKDK